MVLLNSVDYARKIAEHNFTNCDASDVVLLVVSLTNPTAGAVIGVFAIGWDIGTWINSPASDDFFISIGEREQQKKYVRF